MTKLEQTIEENLRYIRELVEKDEGEGGNVLWPFYRGVIAEICRDHVIEIMKWLQHVDNGTEHYNPHTGKTTASIGYDAWECLIDKVKTEECIYELWQKEVNNE